MLSVLSYILWYNIVKPQYSVTFFEKNTIFSHLTLDETREIGYNMNEEEFFQFLSFHEEDVCTECRPLQASFRFGGNLLKKGFLHTPFFGRNLLEKGFPHTPFENFRDRGKRGRST